MDADNCRAGGDELPPLPPPLPPKLPHRLAMIPVTIGRSPLWEHRIVIGGICGMAFGFVVGLVLMFLIRSWMASAINARGASVISALAQLAGWVLLGSLASGIAFGIRSIGSVLGGGVLLFVALARSAVGIVQKTADSPEGQYAAPGPLMVVGTALLFAVAGALCVRRRTRAREPAALASPSQE